MAFDTVDQSAYGGTPIELFLFRDSNGQTVEALTTGPDVFVDGLINFVPGIINRTSVRQTTEDPSGSIQVSLPNESPLAQKFRAYLPVKPISVIVYRYHATDVALERRVLFVGQAISVSFDGDGIAQLSCSPITKAAGKKVPWQLYKKGCNWALYQLGCGVVRALFARATSAFSLAGNTITSAILDLEEDGWFAGGYVQIDATGEQRFIIGHIGNTVQLDYPFFTLVPGVPITFFAGCQRDKETCKNKFNNLINYLGFDYIPSENPYDTNFGPAPGETEPTITTPTTGDFEQEGA